MPTMCCNGPDAPEGTSVTECRSGQRICNRLFVLCFGLNAPSPQQEGLATEALQAIEPAEEADEMLSQVYADAEVQESCLMDGQADLSTIKV